MNACFRLARLRLRLALSSPFTLLTLFILPLALVALTTLFFHAAIGQGGIPVAVVDLDNSQFSRQVVEQLQKEEILTVLESASDRFQQQVLTNQVDSAVVFPQGFQSAIEEGGYAGAVEIYSSSASLGTAFVKEIVATQVMRLASNQAAAAWVTESFRRFGLAAPPDLNKQAWAYTDGQWEPEPLFSIKAMALPDYDEQGGASQEPLLPIALLAASSFLMLFILFSSQWLLEDKEEHRLKRLRTGGVTPSAYFFANACAGFAQGCLQLLAIGGVLLYYFPSLRGNVPQLLGVFGLQVAAWVALTSIIAAGCKARKHGLLAALAVTILTTVAAGPLCQWQVKTVFPQYLTVEAICGGADLWGLTAVVLVLMAISYFVVRWQYGSRG